MKQITLWSMIMICDIPETLRAYAKRIQGLVCFQNLFLVELTVVRFFFHFATNILYQKFTFNCIYYSVNIVPNLVPYTGTGIQYRRVLMGSGSGSGTGHSNFGTGYMGNRSSPRKIGGCAEYLGVFYVNTLYTDMLFKLAISRFIAKFFAKHAPPTILIPNWSTIVISIFKINKYKERFYFPN
jgi:hypothetical protein